MKKILATIIVVLVILGYLGLITAPYHFYRFATAEGVNSAYLKLKKPHRSMLEGGNYKMLRTKEISENSTSQWQNIHFGNFIVPFPLEHPLYLLVPYFKKVNGEHLFGYQVVDSGNREIARVVFEKPKTFLLEVERHRLFQLPLFKNYILSKSMDDIWRDLFQKNILKSPFLKSIWQDPKNNLLIWKVPLQEMSYDLFILEARQRYFPVDTQSISYWKSEKQGLIELEDEESKKGKAKRYSEEVLMLKEGNIIYPIRLRTRRSSYSAKAFKQRFLRTVKYKKSLDSSSVALYSDYKALSYQSKLAPAGFNLLFASLSHEEKSRSFLKEMIQFLERGRNEKVILSPLYRYAFDIFGSSFSTSDENLKETFRERLSREVKNEENKEREEILTIPDVEMPEQFDSEEDKVKRYLQKAKDKGIDRDRSRDRLVID